VANIARDDPSTLPSDDPYPSRPHAPRPQFTVNWDRNLKPKLAKSRLAPKRAIHTHAQTRTCRQRRPLQHWSTAFFKACSLPVSRTVTPALLPRILPIVMRIPAGILTHNTHYCVAACFT